MTNYLYHRRDVPNQAVQIHKILYRDLLWFLLQMFPEAGGGGDNKSTSADAILCACTWDIELTEFSNVTPQKS